MHNLSFKIPQCSVFFTPPLPQTHCRALKSRAGKRGEAPRLTEGEAIMWFFLCDPERDWKKFVSPFWKVGKSNRAPMVIESCQTPPASRASILFSPSPLVSGSICSLSYSTFISRKLFFPSLFPPSLPMAVTRVVVQDEGQTVSDTSYFKYYQKKKLYDWTSPWAPSEITFKRSHIRLFF